MTVSDLSTAIANYIQARGDARLEKFDKEAEKQRKALVDMPLGLAELEAKLATERQAEQQKYLIPAWLDDAARRAKQISLVTHALKYSHSDAKGSSLYINAEVIQDEYLSTASLPELKIDTVGNAASLDVANLLQLQAAGISLIDLITKGDSSALRPFCHSEEQLAGWMEGFGLALKSQQPGSHQLAKQLYFPVAGSEYHLISPLFASSLTQAMHGRIGDSRFGDEVKASREARRKGQYIDATIVDYSNLAVQTFGGTKPQNISLLNSQRGGKTYLLSCQPPVWQQQEAPPKNSNTFWRRYQWRVRHITRELRDFLVSVVDLESNKPMRDNRQDLVDQLIGEFLQTVALIRTFSPGWTADPDITLTRAEQFLLDPFRANEEFAQARERSSWQSTIADSFAVWLNHQLTHERGAMKDVEHREWLKLMKHQLRMLREDMEVMA